MNLFMYSLLLATVIYERDNGATVRRDVPGEADKRGPSGKKLILLFVKAIDMWLVLFYKRLLLPPRNEERRSPVCPLLITSSPSSFDLLCFVWMAT